MGQSDMGKPSPKQPSAPDPAATAAAQGAANKEAAIATARLNQINETTPYGSTAYTPTGQTVDGIQQFQRTTTLDPAEQALLNQQRGINSQLLGIGEGQLGRVEENFATPLDYSGLPAAPQANDASRQRIEQAMLSRLEPQFANDEEALRTRLSNTGFSMGGEGYNRGMDEFNRMKTDARLAAVGAGGAEQSRQFGLEQSARQQGIQEMLTQRNQPLNELSALLGTSGGVNTPSFSPIPNQQIAPADVTSPIYANYQAQLAQANQRSQANNALLGSMFNLGGTLGGSYMMSKPSDRRLKTDIRRVGTLDNGLNVYLYRYKAGGSYQLGVMAQEALAVVPDAVIAVGGFLSVDYSKVVEQPLHGDEELTHAAA